MDGDENTKGNNTENDIEILEIELKKMSEKLELKSVLKESVKEIEPVAQCNLNCVKTLKGHLSKVYSLDWGNDSGILVTAAQDGKILIWNTQNKTKINMIPLKSNWVMAVAYSETQNLIASGGLDNVCSIHSLLGDEGGVLLVELNRHKGYISSCEFIHEDTILTSSGDMTCIQWSIEKARPIRNYIGHNGDVMQLSTNSTGEYFISGSCDGSVILWDIRTGNYEAVFGNHDADVNTVKFSSNDYVFGTGSDDSHCKIFELRMGCEISDFLTATTSSVSSIDFSSSGRLLFAGYSDNNIVVWDILKEDVSNKLEYHSNRISYVKVSPDGKAFAACSWDKLVSIWA